MNDKEVFEYNNEEEAEIAQIQALFTNQNAVDNVRKQLAKQAELPSEEFCLECGEDIPQARRASARCAALYLLSDQVGEIQSQLSTAWWALRVVADSHILSGSWPSNHSGPRFSAVSQLCL